MRTQNRLRLKNLETKPVAPGKFIIFRERHDEPGMFIPTFDETICVDRAGALALAGPNDTVFFVVYRTDFKPLSPPPTGFRKIN